MGTSPRLSTTNARLWILVNMVAPSGVVVNRFGSAEHERKDLHPHLETRSRTRRRWVGAFQLDSLRCSRGYPSCTPVFVRHMASSAKRGKPPPRQPTVWDIHSLCSLKLTRFSQSIRPRRASAFAS